MKIELSSIEYKIYFSDSQMKKLNHNLGIKGDEYYDWLLRLICYDNSVTIHNDEFCLFRDNDGYYIKIDIISGLRNEKVMGISSVIYRMRISKILEYIKSCLVSELGE